MNKAQEKAFKKLMGIYESKYKRLVKVIWGDIFGEDLRLMDAKIEMTHNFKALAKGIELLGKIHNFDGKLVSLELEKQEKERKITSVSFGRENMPVLYVMIEDSDIHISNYRDKSETMKLLERFKPDKIEIWTESYFKLIWY